MVRRSSVIAAVFFAVSICATHAVIESVAGPRSFSSYSGPSVAPPSSPRTWYLNPEGTGDAPSIQAAVDSAAAGDTLLLADGQYWNTGDNDVDYLGKAITIRSQNGNPSLCRIAGGLRGFIFQSGEGPGSVLRGVLIEGTYLAGIYCNSSAPTIVNCVFESTAPGIRCGNAAPSISECGFGFSSGGVSCDSSSAVVITDCEFTETGSYVECQNSTLTLTDCTFSNTNGALRMTSSTGTVTGCVFTDDQSIAAELSSCADVVISTCRFTGGDNHGLQLLDSPVTVDSCQFLQNNGAGVYSFVSSPTVRACTFAGNFGGGMQIYSGAPQLTNCTFTHNIFYGIYCSDDASPFVNRSIISFTAAVPGPDGGQAFVCGGGSPELMCSDLFGNEGGDWTDCIAGQYGVNGNISLDPLYCDTLNGDYSIDANSPCLPSGSQSCGQLIGVYGEGCGVLTAIESDQPSRFARASITAYPNPFNPVTTVHYTIPSPGYVTIDVFDAGGRYVRTLYEGYRTAGEHTVDWHGRNWEDQVVASGVYILRIKHADSVESRKVVLLK